jgi:hypothetical protein
MKAEVVCPSLSVFLFVEIQFLQQLVSRYAANLHLFDRPG